MKKAEQYLSKIAIILGEDENGNEVYLDQNEDAYKQVLLAMKGFAATQAKGGEPTPITSQRGGGGNRSIPRSNGLH